ncbi:MAG TPA: hypothetical protein VMP03_01330, partial [Methylomirabilota bacterium]|nr:hypothetical protein [Methylomirabilota bacterium]
GAATYRMHLLATGAAKPRDGEIADAGVLDRILVECELEDLVAARDRVRTLGAAVRGIEKVIIAEIGYEAALNLDRLPPIIDGMTAILDAAVARRDPSQALDAVAEDGDAEPETDAASTAAPVRVGAIRSQADAAAALDAAIAYYQSYEPSSPAIPLIEQARASLGRSLYEVIAMLVPDHAATARIHVGAEPAFAVPLKAGANGCANPEPGPTAEISTRAEASALLEQVAHFYRQSEPSSPVPLLIDRARALGSRDFLSLLKDLLPEAALKTMKVGG